MEFMMIRHGLTEGNKNKNYVGRTDESLCEEGREKIKGKKYRKVERIFSSPMKRCLETAECIYPGQCEELDICNDFREMDFGVFEGKNFESLKENLEYRHWIDQKGETPPPQGESMESFAKRNLLTFEQCVETMLERGNTVAALIVHGGTIMALLGVLSFPKEDLYHWQVENGGGYLVYLDEEEWQKGKRFLKVKNQF